MDQNKIQALLTRKFPGQTVKYIGGGTDSLAFVVGDCICRFPKHDAGIYIGEAALLNHIRPFVSVDIPDVRVMKYRGYTFAMHKMIDGHKWSWHKFSWKFAKQRRLADSYAKFLAELHGVDVRGLRAAVPELKKKAVYCSLDDKNVSAFLARFMTPGQMRYFRRRYEEIINAPIARHDRVFIHMGMKGANSRVGSDGALCGVFDFCSGGIYERGRDFVLAYLGRNRRLFRRICRRYYQYTGVRIDTRRVADLAVIEFMWRRRLYPNGKFAPRNDHFIMKNLATAMARFHRLPGPLYWFIYMRMRRHMRRAGE